MILFIILVFVLYSLVNVYLFSKGWKVIPQTKGSKTIYVLVFILLFCSFFLAMLGRDSLPIVVLSVMNTIGMIWLGFMLYLTLFFLLTDLIQLLDRIFHFLPKAMAAGTNLFRRIQCIVGYGLVGLLLCWGYFHYTHPAVVEHQIEVNKYGGNYSHLRIVAISDMHLGVNTSKKRLQKQIEQINDLEPDIILIAGDMIDNSTRPLEEKQLWEELNTLNGATGTYVAMGNHEYIAGVDESFLFFNKTHLRLLVDDKHLVGDSFWLICRDDHSSPFGRKPLAQHLEEARAALPQKMYSYQTRSTIDRPSTELPIIVVDHQPSSLDEAAMNGVDIHISGHTHNGQLWPLNLVVKQLFELPYGYKQKGDTHCFVSSGLGLWGPPFRIGTQSEILLIDVKFTTPQATATEEEACCTDHQH